MEMDWVKKINKLVDMNELIGVDLWVKVENEKGLSGIILL